VPGASWASTVPVPRAAPAASYGHEGVARPAADSATQRDSNARCMDVVPFAGLTRAASPTQPREESQQPIDILCDARVNHETLCSQSIMQRLHVIPAGNR
jgi:hypothetical protein